MTIICAAISLAIYSNQKWRKLNSLDILFTTDISKLDFFKLKPVVKDFRASYLASRIERLISKIAKFNCEVRKSVIFARNLYRLTEHMVAYFGSRSQADSISLIKTRWGGHLGPWFTLRFIKVFNNGQIKFVEPKEVWSYLSVLYSSISISDSSNKIIPPPVSLFSL